jgi:hypothetical protein
MKKSKQRYIKLILVFIFILSIFVDLYNGYVQGVKNTTTTLQFIYKGIVMAIAIPYLSINSKYSKIICMLMVFALISLMYWVICGYSTDVQIIMLNLTKIFYPYLILLFIMHNKVYIEQKQLINYVIVYGVIAALSILITMYFGVAVHKYSGDYSFGVKGFFKAGNDIGLIMLMCNCLSCYMFIKTSQVYYLFANLLLTVGGIMLGTVTGVFGSTFILGMLVFNGLMFGKNRKMLKLWQKIYFTLLLILSVPVLYHVIQFIIFIDDYNIDKFSLDRLLSGGARDWLRDMGIKILKSNNIGDWMFGTGYPSIIELDQYDMLIPYGLLLGGLLLLIPVIIAIIFVRNYIKYKTSLYFWFSTIMILFLLHGFSAGHAYTNIYAMSIVGVLYFCHIKVNYKKYIK